MRKIVPQGWRAAALCGVCAMAVPHKKQSLQQQLQALR
jgi:hypothetical protein